MLYRILKFLMKLSLNAHYIDIKGIGFNTIPKKGPLLIASSHPNSFLDAILIAVLLNRPLHFLARSDVFKAKWADYILRKLNLIPIYRLQEGLENLNRNARTFEECNAILENNGAILIFVEGISLIDMKLRPLKKGLARIAFDFAEKTNFKKPCHIIPIGINYDRPKEFRSKISVGVGRLLNILDYEANYRTNKNAAFGVLNKVLYKEIQEHTIEVEDDVYMIYKAVAELDSCFEQNSLSRKMLIANHIRDIKKKDLATMEELKNTILEAFSILKKNKLNFRKLKINTGLRFFSIITLIVTSPFAFLALIANAIPFIIAKKITDKKVKLDEFYASVRLVLGTILWILWSLLLSISLLYFSPLFILLPIPLYFSILFYLNFYEKLKYTNASLQLSSLRKDLKQFNHLQQLIKKIYRLRKELGLAPKVD